MKLYCIESLLLNYIKPLIPDRMLPLAIMHSIQMTTATCIYIYIYKFHFMIIIASISSCLFYRSVEFVALIGVSCTLFLFLHTQSLTTRLREMEDKLQPSMSAGGLISGIANNLIQGTAAVSGLESRAPCRLAQSPLCIISKTICPTSWTEQMNVFVHTASVEGEGILPGCRTCLNETDRVTVFVRKRIWSRLK